jgi:nuclear pore complex protein Nup205
VYWVFEAKIAFLLAYATTRKGAEDLLDAGLFEILSTCGFIAAQPYAEDTCKF